jgi:hypothetical protein
MSKPTPWFERPWRRTGTGARSWAAVAGYLAAGICGFVLAAIGANAAVRVGWASFSIVFMLLGITLLVTLVQRRKREGVDP